MPTGLDSGGPDLSLFDERKSALEQPGLSTAAVGSILAHAVIILLIFIVPWGPGEPRKVADLAVDFRKVTPLVAPPLEFTQKTPSKTKSNPEVTLQSLLSKPNLPVPPPKEPGMMRPATPKPQYEAAPQPAPPAPKPLIEAPKIEEGKRDPGDTVARALPPAIGVQADLPTPPPQIQPEEKPKLSFEKPGGMQGVSRSSGVIQSHVPQPRTSSVDDAIRAIARSGGSGITVGDTGEGLGGLGESINNPRAPRRNSSSLELLSDPMGVDFRPYLIRILSEVRRNWIAVLPESARLGRRGRVLIQFAINRDGSVPKLVIASPSGTEAFDRAAVAGISASNPFPPLPDEFKGGQVRLQFSFTYNIPAR